MGARKCLIVCVRNWFVICVAWHTFIQLTSMRYVISDQLANGFCIRRARVLSILANCIFTHALSWRHDMIAQCSGITSDAMRSFGHLAKRFPKSMHRHFIRIIHHFSALTKSLFCFPLNLIASFGAHRWRWWWLICVICTRAPKT